MDERTLNDQANNEQMLSENSSKASSLREKWRENPMPNWLKQRAYLTPDRTALLTGEENWTFAQLDKRAQNLAYLLQRQGVRAGDHVALLMNNGSPFVQLLHAITYVGATVVPLNIRLTAQELRWQTSDVQATLLIYDQANEDKGVQLQEHGEAFHLQTWSTLECQLSEVDQANQESGQTIECDRHEIQEHFHSDQVHCIMYTSGTTGKPKGVQLTFGNHWSSAIGSALNLGLTEHDRWLAFLPLFHMGGISIIMRSVIYGMTVILHEKFDPQKVNQAITEQQVTHVSVVTATLKKMIAERGEKSFPSTLRCVLLGGGPAPKPLLEQCRQLNIPVYQSYGMTETASQTVTLSPESMLSKLGSAGKPLFPFQLRIEENGQRQPPGEPGEIVVKGPNVMKGYWNRPQATARVIRDGWLYTGDIGYVDQDGFLYVLDRRSDLIISGGENVYPAEIESVLQEHPSIREAGVTGVEDAQWGQVPVAFIVFEQDEQGADDFPLKEEALKTFCEQRLAKYKVPVRFYAVHDLPRNASNKLLRRELLKFID